MKLVLLSLLLMFTLSAVPTIAQKSVMEAVVTSKDHSEFLAAVKAAGLVEMLRYKGPFTVFAPTNRAFDKLPSSTLENLLKPENKSKLTKVMIYHIIAGNLDLAAVMKAISDGNGQTIVQTMNGAILTATLQGTKIVLTDTKGMRAVVTATDMKAGNGMIHSIDAVLLPM